MENLGLIVAAGATLLVVWWIVKKLFKLAVVFAAVGVIALVWFFVVR
jgi:hypothetical protein